MGRELQKRRRKTLFCTHIGLLSYFLGCLTWQANKVVGGRRAEAKSGEGGGSSGEMRLEQKNYEKFNGRRKEREKGGKRRRGDGRNHLGHVTSAPLPPVPQRALLSTAPRSLAELPTPPPLGPLATAKLFLLLTPGGEENSGNRASTLATPMG